MKDITKEEFKELHELINYIEDERTVELIRKLMAKFNKLLIYRREHKSEIIRTNYFEVKYEEEKQKNKELNEKINKIKIKDKKLMEESIEYCNKYNKALVRIEELETYINEK